MSRPWACPSLPMELDHHTPSPSVYKPRGQSTPPLPPPSFASTHSPEHPLPLPCTELLERRRRRSLDPLPKTEQGSYSRAPPSLHVPPWCYPTLYYPLLFSLLGDESSYSTG